MEDQELRMLALVYTTDRYVCKKLLQTKPFTEILCHFKLTNKCS